MIREVSMHIRYFCLAKMFLLFSILLLPGQIFSQEPIIGTSSIISFDDVWSRVLTVSPGQKEAALEKQAAEIARDRSSRHWLPRAFAEYRYFVTNDPGTVFFSNMGQRAVTQSDFSPPTLNYPDAVRVGKGTIGVDLPLYEGGSRSAENLSLSKMNEGKIFAEKYVRKYEFGTSAVSYGLLSSLRLRRERLSALKDQVQLLLSGYREDLKSNPVEYSGILGLKALNNRLKALLDENESRIQSEMFYLGTITGNSFPKNWSTGNSDILDFVEIYLPRESTADDTESYRVKEYQSYAESAKKKAEGQKSVFLPTLGLFSNVDIYNGERRTDHSYTAGFYARMNLFAPIEYGSVEQAKTESEAVKAKADNAKMQEEIERDKMIRMHATFKNNIPLLRNSLTLMNEQTANSFRLFSNGSMKAFQLVEVLSRKTDLIENLREAEEGYLSNASGLYILSTTDREIKNEK
jgi:hypothetical protein